MPQTCPYCRESIAERDLAECTVCRTPHHQDCWSENGGCTVFGCARAPTEDAKIVVSAHDLAGAPALAAPAGPSYFIARNGAQYGPYPLDVLQREAGAGSIRLDDLAWTQGQAQWMPVSQILGMSNKAQKLPPVDMPMQGYLPSLGAAEPSVGPMHFGRGVYFCSLFALTLIFSLFKGPHEPPMANIVIYAIAWLSLAVLRTRDTGTNGWAVLVLLIPIANLGLGLYLLFAPRGHALRKG